MRRRAIEDPDYLRGVLLEVQRLWPPFIGGRRIADQVELFASYFFFHEILNKYAAQY